MSPPSATCIGFYGFKGGAGRSQLAAHVYAQLASEKETGPILVIDWDLEAPGIGDMLDLAPPFDEGRWRSHRGINELAQDLREFGLEAAAGERAPEAEEATEAMAAEYRAALIRFLAEREWVEPMDADDFRLREDCWSGFKAGIAERPEDRFLGPGLFVSQGDYAANMVTADWLGQLREGYGLFDEAFWELIRAKFAYILLDLRTGFNTASFGAMARIVDKLVIVSPSRVESLGGVEAIAELLTRRDMPVWLATSYHVRSTEQGWIPEADRDPYVLATAELLKNSFKDFRSDKLITLPRSEIIANIGRRLSPRILLDHMTGERVEDDAAAIARIELLLADVPNLDRSISAILDEKLDASAGDGKSREIRKPTDAFGDNADRPRGAIQGIRPTWSDLAYCNAVADLCAELCAKARPMGGTRFRIPASTKEYEFRMLSRLLGGLEIDDERKWDDARKWDDVKKWIDGFQARLESLSAQLHGSWRSLADNPPSLEQWLFDSSPRTAEQHAQDGAAGIGNRLPGFKSVPSLGNDGESGSSLSLYIDYAFLKLGLGRFLFDLFESLDNPESLTRECSRLGIPLPEEAYSGGYWDYLTNGPRPVFDNTVHDAIVGLSEQAGPILGPINIDKRIRSRISQEDPAKWPAIADILQWILWVQDEGNWQQIDDKAGLAVALELASDRVVRHPALTARKANQYELSVASEAMRCLSIMLDNFGSPNKAYRALIGALRFHNLANYINASPERINAAYLKKTLIEAGMAIGMGNAGFAMRSGTRMIELRNRIPGPETADVTALGLDSSDGLYVQDIRLNMHLYPGVSHFDLERWPSFDDDISSFEQERARYRQLVRHQDRKLVMSLAREGRNLLRDYKLARDTEMVDDFASTEPPLAHYRSKLHRVEARIVQNAACPTVRDAGELISLHRRIARLLWLSGRREDALEQIDRLDARRAAAAETGFDVFAAGPAPMLMLERIAFDQACWTIGDHTPQAFRKIAMRRGEAMSAFSAAIEIAIPGLQASRENVNLLKVSNCTLDAAMASAGQALSSENEAWAALARELAQAARERASTFGRSNGEIGEDYRAAHALLDYRHALLNAALARQSEPPPPDPDLLSSARARAVRFIARRHLHDLQPETGMHPRERH